MQLWEWISRYYMCHMGEIYKAAVPQGLKGEFKPRTEQRVAEAARLGFKRIVISGFGRKGMKVPDGIEVVAISSIEQLPKALF